MTGSLAFWEGMNVRAREATEARVVSRCTKCLVQLATCDPRKARGRPSDGCGPTAWRSLSMRASDCEASDTLGKHPLSLKSQRASNPRCFIKELKCSSTMMQRRVVGNKERSLWKGSSLEWTLAAMSMHDNCHGGRPVRLRLHGSGDAHSRGDAYGTVPCGSGDALGRHAARSMAVKVRAR